MTLSVVNRDCRTCYLVTTRALRHGHAVLVTWYSVVSIPRDLFLNRLLLLQLLVFLARIQLPDAM